MSTDGSADEDPGADRPTAARRGAAASRRRVVISSVTGKPIDWDGAEESASGRTAAPEGRPLLPDRVAEDAPEPDESHDARIAGDVPPHWGRGR